MRERLVRFAQVCSIDDELRKYMSKMPRKDSIALLGIVYKESIEQANADKKYFFRQTFTNE